MSTKKFPLSTGTTSQNTSMKKRQGDHQTPRQRMARTGKDQAGPLPGHPQAPNTHLLQGATGACGKAHLRARKSRHCKGGCKCLSTWDVSSDGGTYTSSPHHNWRLSKCRRLYAKEITRPKGIPDLGYDPPNSNIIKNWRTERGQPQIPFTILSEASTSIGISLTPPCLFQSQRAPREQRLFY